METKKVWTVSNMGGSTTEVWIDDDGDVNFGGEWYVCSNDIISLAEAVKNELNNTQEGE